MVMEAIEEFLIEVSIFMIGENGKEMKESIEVV